MCALPILSASRSRMTTPRPKLALIAGGGDIPALIRDACIAEGRPLYIAALSGFCAPATVTGVEHDWFDLPPVGRLLKALKQAGAAEVCPCGSVSKPDFARLQPDRSDEHTSELPS